MFRKICKVHSKFNKFANYNSLAKKVDISEISIIYYKELIDSVKKLNFTPKLVSFHANDDKGALQYAKWTDKICTDLGIKFELKKINKLELEYYIEIANNDKNINGIMIYYPCFGSTPSFYGDTMDNYLRDKISNKKDVEGLCYKYRKNLYHNIRFIDNDKLKKSILPCTPLGVIKILESDLIGVYNKNLSICNQLNGKIITVINRSAIVGHPIAAMLANDGCDVYSVDLDGIYYMKKGKMINTSITLENACKISDVIITGVPDKNFKLNSLWIKPNTTIINLSPYKNINIEEIRHIKGIKFVPQVGSVTICMLLRNLLNLINNYQINNI